MSENSQLIAISEADDKVSDEASSMMSMIRDIAKDHPVIAIILIIVMGAGVPTGFSFFGAQSGAIAAIDTTVKSHEARISKLEIQQEQYQKDVTDIKVEIRGISTDMGHVLRAVGAEK